MSKPMTLGDVLRAAERDETEVFIRLVDVPEHLNGTVKRMDVFSSTYEKHTRSDELWIIRRPNGAYSNEYRVFHLSHVRYIGTHHLSLHSVIADE